MKNITFWTGLALLFAVGPLVFVAVGEQENGCASAVPLPLFVSPSVPALGTVSVPFEEPFVLFQVVICESPFENDKFLAETLADRMREMTAPINGRLVEPKMSDALKQLEDEKKLTVLSRPQMAALNNQTAFLMVGSRDEDGQERGWMFGITPQIQGNRISTEISMKRGNLSKQDNTAIGTNVSLQDGVPVFVGGILSLDSNNAKKEAKIETAIYITAIKVARCDPKPSLSVQDERSVSYLKY